MQPNGSSTAPQGRWTAPHRRKRQPGYTWPLCRTLAIPGPRPTQTHNAATNCYRFRHANAGNLRCQLLATSVNFFPAGGSALVILTGKYMKCRGVGISCCAVAVRLDGSMTLMHLCASAPSRPRRPSRFAWATHLARTTARLSGSFPRRWTYRTPVGVSAGPQFACQPLRLFVDERSCPMRAPGGSGESTRDRA
jgi:hypothetical protein